MRAVGPLYHSSARVVRAVAPASMSLLKRVLIAHPMIRVRPHITQFGERPEHKQKNTDGGAQHQPEKHMSPQRSGYGR